MRQSLEELQGKAENLPQTVITVVALHLARILHALLSRITRNSASGERRRAGRMLLQAKPQSIALPRARQGSHLTRVETPWV